jgi:hypothetical protein
MRNAFLIIGTVMMLCLAACSKKQETVIILPKPADIVGKWTLYQIFGNDHWGGAAYWKTANPATKFELTADVKYFRKNATQTTYTLIGTYTKLPNNKIQITWANPIQPAYPTYTLDYDFETGGFMTWGTFDTEGMIKEKFKIDN